MARNSLKGMLLMEAILSSSLLALVAFFVLTLLPTSSLLLHQGRFRGHAMQWAESVLENLEGPGRVLPAPGKLAVPDHQFDGVLFRTSVEICALAGEAPEKLVQASCTVQWSDALGRHQTIFGGYLGGKP